MVTVGACGSEELDDGHPGWRQALCFDCHGKTTGYPHGGSGRREPGCRDCHGTNGAPLSEHASERQGCAGSACHDSVSHATSFQAPADCRGCHAP